MDRIRFNPCQYRIRCVFQWFASLLQSHLQTNSQSSFYCCQQVGVYLRIYECSDHRRTHSLDQILNYTSFSQFRFVWSVHFAIDWSDLYLLGCCEFQTTHLSSDFNSKKDFYYFVEYFGVWTSDDNPPVVCDGFGVWRDGLWVCRRGKLPWKARKVKIP